jgi:hypothetical protein
MQNYKDANGNVHVLSAIDIVNGGISYLPAGCVEITQAEADALLLAQRPPLPPVTVVTPLQARRALAAAGLLPAVNAAVAASSADAQMAWEFATAIHRTDATILALAQTLNLSPAQLDSLFASAATFSP